METLLLSLIVLLAGTICALSGFWFHRATQEYEQRVRPLQSARSPARHGRWGEAVHASRDRI